MFPNNVSIMPLAYDIILFVTKSEYYFWLENTNSLKWRKIRCVRWTSNISLYLSCMLVSRATPPDISFSRVFEFFSLNLTVMSYIWTFLLQLSGLTIHSFFTSLLQTVNELLNLLDTIVNTLTSHRRSENSFRHSRRASPVERNQWHKRLHLSLCSH